MKNNILFLILFVIIISANNLTFTYANNSLEIILKDLQNEKQNKITLKELCLFIRKFEQNTEFNFNLEKSQSNFNNIEDENIRLCAQSGILDIKDNLNIINLREKQIITKITSNIINYSLDVNKLEAVEGTIVGPTNIKFDASTEFVTRQELAVIIYNIADKISDIINKEELNFKNEYKNSTINPNKFPHVFKDGRDIRSFAREKINWIYRQGIMGVDENNCFNFNKYCTREDVYESLLNLYDVYNGVNKKPETEYYPIYNQNYYSDSDYNYDFIDIYGEYHIFTDVKKLYPFYKKYHKKTDPSYINYYFDAPPLKYIVDSKDERNTEKIIKKKLGMDEDEYFQNVYIYNNIAEIKYEYPMLTTYVNLDTQEIYEDIIIELWDEKDLEQDILITKSISTSKELYGYINIKNNKQIKPIYIEAGAFCNGKAIVKNQDDSYSVIDKDFNIIKNFNLFITEEYYISHYGIKGEYILVSKRNEDKKALYKAGDGFLTDFVQCNYSNFLLNGQVYNLEYINEAEYYKLYDKNGRIVSECTEFLEIDKGRYIVKPKNKNNYVFIDENGKKLRDLGFNANFTYFLLYDRYEGNPPETNNGLFVYQSGIDKFDIIDYYGDLIGQIKVKIIEEMEIEIVNGLIHVSYPKYTSADVWLDNLYYLPTGEFVFKENFSKLRQN